MPDEELEDAHRQLAPEAAEGRAAEKEAVARVSAFLPAPRLGAGRGDRRSAVGGHGRAASSPHIRHRRTPPPPRYARVPLPRCAALTRGRKAPSFSRRPFFAPELCRYEANKTKQTKQRPGVIFVRRRRWWNRPHQDRARKDSSSLRGAFATKQSRTVPPSLDCFVASLLAMTKRKAERRQTCSTTSAPRGHGAPPPHPPPLRGARRGRSPVGVPPRHLRQRPNATAQLQPRDFRGLGRRARPDGSKDARFATHGRNSSRPTRHRGCYPRLPVPVQRDCTRSPVMMPSGRVLPKPPGSTGDEPMPAGTAPAPPPGGPPDGVLVRERGWGYVTEQRTFVNDYSHYR